MAENSKAKTKTVMLRRGYPPLERLKSASFPKSFPHFETTNFNLLLGVHNQHRVVNNCEMNKTMMHGYNLFYKLMSRDWLLWKCRPIM